MFELSMLFGFLAAVISTFLPARRVISKFNQNYIPSHRKDWK